MLTITWCSEVDVPDVQAFICANGLDAAAPDLRLGEIRPSYFVDNPYASTGLLRQVAKAAPESFGLKLAIVRRHETVCAIALYEFARNRTCRYGILHDLVVGRDWRGRGIGQLLLDWIECEARQVAIQVMFLEVALADAAAGHLFQSAGYAPCATIHAKRLAPGELSPPKGRPRRQG